MIMLRSIDIRSFLIGGLLVISVMSLMGAVDFTPPEFRGRFKMTTNPNYAFILDSDTGQVWSQIFPDDLNGIHNQSDEFHSPKVEVNHIVE